MVDRIPFLVVTWLLHRKPEYLLPRLTRKRVVQCALVHLATAFVYTFTVLAYAGIVDKPLLYHIDSGKATVPAVGVTGAVLAGIVAIIYYIAAVMRFVAWTSEQPILGAMTMGYTAVPSMKIRWDDDRFVGQKPVNVKKFAIGRYDGWVV
jgi:hypothetical protein